MKNLSRKTGLISVSVILLLLAIIFCRYSQSVLSSKTIIAKNGGVASAHQKASAAGVGILKQGGNAADAATAVAFALAVVYPQAGNLGGGGFLVMREADAKTAVLDFRETAPAMAQENMYLDENGKYIPESSTLGALAIGVPGTVRGFHQFHQKYGRLKWADVIQPSIELAENGFEINAFLENRLTWYRDQLSKFSSTANIFLRDGQPLKSGSILVQSDLANTLKRIAKTGDRDFYSGEIAGEIIRSVAEAGGILSKADLENYQPLWRQPMAFEYQGHKIIAVPPPSSGGVLLKGILSGLEMQDMSGLKQHSADQIALVAEWEKQFFALRNQYIGDPAFVDNPLDEILSPNFIADISKNVSRFSAFPSHKLFTDHLNISESRETTHFSVVDKDGNAVSVTYTLNGNFGSKFVAGSTGILMNNEMDDFTIKPGIPNMFGLVQGSANKIEAGKRMLSSMTPVIVEKDGKLAGLLGSPGGPTIITTVLQTLINKIAYKQNLSDAILTKRFHHQWLPDKLYMEKAFPLAVEKELENRGYLIEIDAIIGDVHGIWRADNGWEICSDPRGNGIPVGF